MAGGKKPPRRPSEERGIRESDRGKPGKVKKGRDQKPPRKPPTDKGGNR
jgi:hypothetical protein